MNLSTYMAREGLTLTRLAEKLGCKVPTVHGWITGYRRPSWAALARIEAGTAGAVTASDFSTAHAAETRPTPKGCTPGTIIRGAP